MKKIMFNDKYGLTQAVLEGRKTQTRRIADTAGRLRDITVRQALEEVNKGRACLFDEGRPLALSAYKLGETIAIAQKYADLAYDGEFFRLLGKVIFEKGAVSAENGEQLIIPLNMRDGSLICRGKGNDDWLQSAPHGAGRLMSRSAAKKQLSMEEYRQQMHDIYSTSVCESTIDESPMAYKSAVEIEDLIGDTVTVVKRIKPIYNFKAK